MPQESGLTAVAHVIQLAVAPVFLISGIGAFLNVLNTRLGRIIDRARVLENQSHVATGTEYDTLETELKVLGRRAGITYRAISLTTVSALLISGVVSVLFLGAFFVVDFSYLVGPSFIAAMIALIGGLVEFLREVRIATQTLRIGPKVKRK